MGITARSVRVIGAATERVWRALTTPEEVRIWMPPGFTKFEARAGGRFRAEGAEGGFPSHGTIVTWEPPHRLGFTCVIERFSLEMRIRYGLEAHPRGTRIAVEESGFEGMRPPLRKLFPLIRDRAAAPVFRDLFLRQIRQEGRSWAASARKLLTMSRAHWRRTLDDLKGFCERGL